MDEKKIVEKTENEEFVCDKTIKVFKWRIPVGHVKSDEKPEEGVEGEAEKGGKMKTLKKVGKIAIPIAAAGGVIIGAIAALGHGKSDEAAFEDDGMSAYEDPIPVDSTVESIDD